MVITTTAILTTTWTFTDVVVTTSGVIRQIAWNQDGELFAVATSVGMFIYGADTLEVERSISIGEPVQSVAFSPVEDLLASGSLKGDIQWWFPDTGRYAGSFKGGRLGVNSLSFSAQEDVMASGSDDGTIRVWNPAQLLDSGIVEYQPLNTWRAADRITSVDINQNVQLAAAGSYQTVSVWDLGTGELIQTLDDLKGWVSDIALSPDGGVLAVADSSNRLRLWETASWKLTHDIPLEVFDSITGIDFNRNGMRLALGGKNGRVVIWNVPSNALFDPVTIYAFPVTGISFHPRENILLSSHNDGTLRLWSFQ
jgi:WD40 repeat protein